MSKNPLSRPSQRKAAVSRREALPVRAQPSRELQVFDNPAPARDYTLQFQIPEFTCVCPLTGQPDFAHFVIDCVPDQWCVELKSLKLYMWSYRNEGAFHEKVTNQVLDDLVAAMAPRFLRVHARWYVRGGIYTNVTVDYRKKGWRPAAAIVLPEASPPRGGGIA